MKQLRPLKTAKPLRTVRDQPPNDPYLQNLARLGQLKRQPPIKTPPLPYPHAAEASYRRKLTRVADAAFALVQPLIDELWAWQRLADAEQTRADADEDLPDIDEPPYPEGVTTIAQRGAEQQAKLRERAAKQNRPHTAAEKAQLGLPGIIEQTLITTQTRLDLFADGIPPGVPAAVAKDIERHAVAVNLRVFESLGVNPIKPGTALDQARTRWIETNAALIKSQPAEVSTRIGDIVREMVPAGARWETIARKLEDEHGIAQRRAALIARDQVGKYNADCNRTQQQAAGFTHYEWMGVMDNRERPTHVALQHTIWSWDKPPPIGNPGEPIQCRCTASPVISEADTRKTADWDADTLAAKTAELGRTQAESEDITEEQIAARAARDVRSEIRLAQTRETVAAR